MSLKRLKPVLPEAAAHPSAQQSAQLISEEAPRPSGGQLVPIPLEVIPLQAPLACALYVKVAGSFILFRHQGEVLTGERVLSLQKKGATTIYVHKSSWQLFEETLEGITPSGALTPREQTEQLRNLILVCGQELERRIKSPKRPFFEKLGGLSAQLSDALEKDPLVGASLIRRHRDPLLYFIEHTLNVAIYATLIGRKVGIGGETLRLLTFGALLHDIGFLHIPRQIAYSANPLTPEQEKEYRDHSRQGAELLQTTGAAPSVVLCALQHHEREDGNGYPARMAGSLIHLHAKIVAIADTYDDLVGPHPGRAALPPLDAVEAMRRMRGRFDPKLVDLVASAT